MLDHLRQIVLEANRALATSGLVRLTWGNVSGIDRAGRQMVIKPSGVPYADLRMEDLAILDLDSGQQVGGTLRPSSDAPTHLELYRAFPKAGGICHTHSPLATAWAQAGRPLPCFGTTHADHFYGPVPVCRILTEAETAEDYEGNTGRAIVEHFVREGLDPMAVPAVLQLHHAPFTWGRDPREALDNSIALETCAGMALETLRINPEASPLPRHLLDKHYLRKHGPGAYYGQPSDTQSH